jgi:hypothetical protein
MNNETQQEEVSGYDKEWELESDDPTSSSTATYDDPKTDSDDDLSDESASPVQSSDSPETSASNPEVGQDDDVWAGATSAQVEAFRRAENEKIAATNRAKINADKLAERGRELKTLRDETTELREATRPRTEFETEHSTYASDINVMIEQRLAERLPVQPEQTQAEIDQDTYEVITNAHPDAGDLYNSEGIKSLLTDDPVFKVNGKAVLFSDALHSTNPNDVNAALDFYKSNHYTAPPANPDPLHDMQVASPRGAAHDMRTAGQLTQSEQYDVEWDTDDD